MTEGWFNDDYWILCEDVTEAEQVTALYGVAEYLPDYLIVGLKGWDDFILCNRESRYFTVPTVPLDKQYLEPFDFPVEPMKLEADKKLVGKIKWYETPIIFLRRKRTGFGCHKTNMRSLSAGGIMFIKMQKESRADTALEPTPITWSVCASDFWLAGGIGGVAQILVVRPKPL